MSCDSRCRRGRLRWSLWWWPSYPSLQHCWHCDPTGAAPICEFSVPNDLMCSAACFADCLGTGHQECPNWNLPQQRLLTCTPVTSPAQAIQGMEGRQPQVRCRRLWQQRRRRWQQCLKIGAQPALRNSAAGVNGRTVGSPAVMTAVEAGLVALMRFIAWQGCADHLPAVTPVLQLGVYPFLPPKARQMMQTPFGFGIHHYRSHSETRLRSQAQGFGARRSRFFRYLSGRCRHTREKKGWSENLVRLAAAQQGYGMPRTALHVTYC
jgi:hypothetical protein